MKIFFDNLTNSGLVQDPLRGCGSSASDRETPSRVRGTKSAGDPDTGMNGHQFVMDDHPNSQMMRMRTSKGAQLLLSDTGDFIYMNTATGKAWMELDDAGNMHVYAHSSVNFHTEQDFNFTCDKDLNFHVGGNYNMLVKKDTNMRLAKNANITVGESGGDGNFTVVKGNHYISSQTGQVAMGAKKEVTVKADAINTHSDKSTTMKAGESYTVGAKTATVAGETSTTVGAKNNLALVTGGTITAQNNYATTLIARPPDVTPPPHAKMAILHSLPSPPRTNGPPLSPNGLANYQTLTVPQHEPWMGHRGGDTTRKVVSPSKLGKNANLLKS